jgi:hypothetical protein
LKYITFRRFKTVYFEAKSVKKNGKEGTKLLTTKNRRKIQRFA